jgi:hypothetical protein
MTNKELEAKVRDMEARVKELEEIVTGKAVITIQQTPTTQDIVAAAAGIPPQPVNISPQKVVNRSQVGYDLG